MIGNDIVDLAKAKKESNWQRKCFLDKLFTENEQELILTSNNPEQMVWNLWSRKEAAYKIYNRQSGKRFFNPKRFVCEANKVIFGTNHYYTQTQITTDFIYTIACAENEYFKQIKSIDIDAKINKRNGIPFIIDSNSKIEKPVSISHHGRFWKGIIIE